MAADFVLCRTSTSFYAIASCGMGGTHFHPCLRSSAAFVHARKWSRLPHKVTRGRRRLAARSFVQEVFLDVDDTSEDIESSQESFGHETCQSVTVLEATHPIKTIEESPSGLPDDDAGLIFALPTLQVQSLQEQEALAATPAHPKGLYALYATFFAGNFVEQVWNFAWPSAVALLHDSLLPVAVVSFVSKFVIFVSGPWVGAKMDSLPRVFAFNALSVVQTVAQLISTGAIVHALNNSTPSASSTHTLLLQPWFVILVAMQAIERLTGLACGVAFERDWVVQLAGASRPIALAEANAMLCRVDYICEMIGTSIFGILLSKYCPAACLKIAAAVMIGSLPFMIVLACSTNRLSKNVLERPKRLQLRELLLNQSLSADKSSTSSGKDGFQVLKQGWSQYLSQPALPVSLATVFLFLNIGLAPGNLMTTFLTQKSLNPSIIGAFSGVGAFMGLAATFFSAALVRKLGLLRAGAAGLVFQAFALMVAVLIYWSNSMSHFNSLLLFLAAIVLSRLGHFTYDIVGGQILQTAVHPSQANTIGATEVSLASLAELVMLGVAIVANDASHFRSLVALSMVAVLGAATVYHRWMSSLSTSPSSDLSLSL